MTCAAPVPRLQADAPWPLPLPHDWALGEVAGVATGASGDVWILQRPATMSARGKAAAPPVIEFDAAGHVLRAWGGPGRGYDWFEKEHGISLDAQGFVWLSGNGAHDGQVLKFTPEGRFVLQIGRKAQGAASADTTRLGRPAGMAVDTQAHEVYIADGYANRRVIVFDSETGAFHRMWGANGGVPADTAEHQFGTPVHCVRLSQDGLVYVCDRRNDRVQVFRKDGRFVAEWRVAPRTGGMGSVWDLAFSADAAQGFVFVADGTNDVVHILRRGDGAEVGTYGAPSQFSWLHDLATNSAGDLFTGEVHDAKRAQKFIQR